MKEKKENLFKRIKNRALAVLAVVGLSIGGAESAGMLPEYSTNTGVGRSYNHVLNDENETVQTIKNKYFDYYDVLAEDSNLVTFRQTIPSYNGSIDITVPQGLCHIDNYTIITAYNGNQKYRNQAAFNSNNREELELMQSLSFDNRAMLIVLNSETNEEEAILRLPDDNHVGGITTDGENLYIAKSSEYEISVIEYDNLKKCIENNEDEINYDESYKCANLPSYITYDDNKLWVGTWKSENIIDYQATLCAYKIEGDKLKKVDEYVIPQYTNGACFMDRYNQKILILSISNGRYMDSYLMGFRVNQDKNSLEKIGQITAPPLAENIDIVDENINVLFESGSPVYSGIASKSTSYPIEGYMKINIDKMIGKMLQQKENEEQRRMKKVSRVDKYFEESEEEYGDDEKIEDDEKEK